MATFNDHYSSFIQDAFEDEVNASVILEALSHVEIIGSNLILKVPQVYWDQKMQNHCMDELGHSKILLEQANKIKYKLSPNQLFKAQALHQKALGLTEDYLKNLVHKCLRKIRIMSKNENRTLGYYYLISLLIERRLMKIYPLILISNAPQNVIQTVKKIIADERVHMDGVLPPAKDLVTKFDLELSDFFLIESEIARPWLLGLQELLTRPQEQVQAL